jgi:PAS domain S-box-containing protein
MRTFFDKKLVAGLGILTAVLVVSAAVVYRNTRQLHEDANWVIHSHEVLDSLGDLLSTMKDAETGQRGFLITGDERYLRPFQEAVARVPGILDKVQQLTEDNPSQQARVGPLRELVGAKLDELRRTIALRNEHGFEAAQREVLTHLGRNLMEKIRASVAEMRSAERALLTIRQQANARTNWIALSSGLIISLVALLAIGGFAWLLNENLRSRAEAATAIYVQQERFRTTLTSIGDAVIVTDTEGRVTFVNPIAATLTGYREEEAKGLPLQSVLNIVNEETRKEAENPVARVLAQGQIVGLANHTVLIAKDGSERPIDDSAAPIRDQYGRLTGVVLVFRDITERKHEERERRVLTRQLIEDDRRKDEFLATLAHELRNPLAPVRNAVELLRHGGDDPVVMREARGIIERQLEHMVRLIDDLLDIARVTSGKLQLRKGRVELATVVRSAVDEVRPLIAEAGHELTVSLLPEAIFVDADPTRLGQVFSNLLNNAAKYTDKGGHIWVTEERGNGEVAISVRDTGIGIAAEHLPHIFEMFAQAAPALERAQGGLGVGLALVRGLVDLHGGRIEAHSGGPRMGSEFIVHLPVDEHEPQPRAEQPRAGESGQAAEQRRPAAARRILVVDDNVDSAQSLAMLLNRMGHETQMAYDGLEAVQAAAAFKPQIILLDIGLPKLNGYEAAKKIREQASADGLAIIALSGWGQDRDKQRALESGFDHHLTKPVDYATLEKLLTIVHPS